MIRLPAFLYNFFVVPAMYVGFHLLAPFNEKVRRGMRGRKELFPQLQKKLAALPSHKNRILIHAASMGEFEQARPILRAIRRRFPDVQCCLSVFSPSAYDHLQSHPEVDLLTYLPFDSRRNVHTFLKLLKPTALIFIRYDLWPNLVWQARRSGCKTVLVDASLQETSLRKKSLIKQFNRAIFADLDLICCISRHAGEQIRQAFSPNAPVEITGDTRFDQVVFRAKERAVSDILKFPLDDWQQALVAGSTWPEDETVLLPAFAKLRRRVANVKLILAPHEPSPVHLAQCEKACAELSLSVARLSDYSGNKPVEVLLIDRIGILANLYGAGKAAFVGGSFGPGVHNVIEPAAHSIPVLFGPKMRNSPEAIEMLATRCGIAINSSEELFSALELLFRDEKQRAGLAQQAARFVAERTGADENILDLLANILQKRS